MTRVVRPVVLGAIGALTLVELVVDVLVDELVDRLDEDLR